MASNALILQIKTGWEYEFSKMTASFSYTRDWSGFEATWVFFYLHHNAEGDSIVSGSKNLLNSEPNK